MPGNGNNNPSMGGGFGNSHRSGSATTPTRTFGTHSAGSQGNIGNNAPRGTFGNRPAGNQASNGSNAPRRTFGGAQR